jgi:MtrB/PioB family decaheme-associated outer membrane protein
MKQCLFFCLMLSLILFNKAWAEEKTTVQNIRGGLHRDYKRLVFDCEGAHPLRISPASAEDITFYFEKLDCFAKETYLPLISNGLIANVICQKENNISSVRVVFKDTTPRVKTHILPSEPQHEGKYRLVLDLYPKTNVGSRKPEPAYTVVISNSGESKIEDMHNIDPSYSPAVSSSASEPFFSGEVSPIFTAANGEDDSAKFEEYRDISEPVSGDLNLEHSTDTRFSTFNAENIARDDQHYDLTVGWYGKLKLMASYDELPHRFAYDAKTLYGGVGTENLVLDDGLQARLETGTSTIESEFMNAVSRDIELSRKNVKTKINLSALEPFTFNLEFGRGKREGTRPFFGAFGLSNTIEIFEPIDDETTEVKFTGEYAKRPFFFNISYYFSSFKNNMDNLTWDNPFRLNPILGEGSTGLMDLAPDNQYHNISVSGSYMDLPFKTRVTGSAAWGWMKQDDNLVPYTINPNAGAPLLPAQNVDARVDTSLYNALLTSRPTNWLHLTGKIRYMEYNNKTEQIYFPGFVDADDIFIPDDIGNIPTSYKKTTAALDVGFDVFKRTRLTLGYAYDKKRRTNREVERQTDNKIKASVDTHLFSWLDLGTSYERTNRDIGDYIFDIYLKAGEDLNQLEFLRMYNQADLVRDRLQFLATLYPFEPLVLSGSMIYGKDDFEDSPFGLLDDEHYIFSFDAEYEITDKLNLQAFYSYEKYKNRQKASGQVPTVPFPVDSDWDSTGEDIVNTIGTNAKAVLIPGWLDLDLSYSLSDVDSNIDFFSPAVATSEFTTVDETKLHVLEAKLNYRATQSWTFTFGYLWEKFDYDDFNKEGFTFTPADALFMGTLPEDYSVNLFYIKAAYRF